MCVKAENQHRPLGGVLARVFARDILFTRIMCVNTTLHHLTVYQMIHGVYGKLELFLIPEGRNLLQDIHHHKFPRSLNGCNRLIPIRLSPPGSASAAHVCHVQHIF